jgi:hypothetical protein
MLYRHELLHQVLEGNSVDGGDGIRRDGSAGINGDIRSRKLGPLLHLCVLNINVVIEDRLLELNGSSSELVFPPVRELSSVVNTVFLSETTSNTPDGGEDKDLLESGSLDLLYVKNRLNQSADTHNHRDLYLRDDMFEVLSRMTESLRHVAIEFFLEVVLNFLVTSNLSDPRFNEGSPLVTIGIRDEKNTSS